MNICDISIWESSEIQPNDLACWTAPVPFLMFEYFVLSSAIERKKEREGEKWFRVQEEGTSWVFKLRRVVAEMDWERHASFVYGRLFKFWNKIIIIFSILTGGFFFKKQKLYLNSSSLLPYSCCVFLQKCQNHTESFAGTSKKQRRENPCALEVTWVASQWSWT